MPARARTRCWIVSSACTTFAANSAGHRGRCKPSSLGLWPGLAVVQRPRMEAGQSFLRCKSDHWHICWHGQLSTRTLSNVQFQADRVDLLSQLHLLDFCQRGIQARLRPTHALPKQGALAVLLRQGHSVFDGRDGRSGRTAVLLDVPRLLQSAGTLDPYLRLHVCTVPHLTSICLPGTRSTLRPHPPGYSNPHAFPFNTPFDRRIRPLSKRTVGFVPALPRHPTPPFGEETPIGWFPSA